MRKGEKVLSDETLAYRLRELEDELDEAKAIHKEIFHRLNELEKRMAQVLVIAVAVSLLIPVVTDLVLARH
jgi:hypothetical protein